MKKEDRMFLWRILQGALELITRIGRDRIERNTKED